MVLVTAGGGLLMVGPLVGHAVVRWIGWRVTLPVLLGYVPPSRALGHPRVCCRCCGEVLLSPTVIPAPPMLPWTIVGGRCRQCREPVALWVLAVELVTGALFGLAAWRIGWSLSLIPILVLLTGMVAASTVDLACWRIPSRFVFMTGVAAASAIAVAAAVGGYPASVVGAVVGGVTYLALLGVLHRCSPRQLGRGDVRLGLVIGIVVGWLGWSADQPITGPLTWTFNAALAAAAIALVVGLVLRLVRGSSRAYPFAPWLCSGALVTILLG